jgi:glycosyltransferase involved in cell wall biosynthesis
MPDGSLTNKADVQPNDGRPIAVLHLYRRFAPDFTGDGIYYERLINEPVPGPPISHEVLVFDPPANNARTLCERTAPPHAVHYLRPNPAPGSQWRLLFWMAANIQRFDVLHIHTHVDRRFLSYILARGLGCQVIYSSTLEDSLPELVATYRPIFRPLARRLFRVLSAVVAISPRLYSGVGSLPPDRALLIPQGVAIEPMATAHERARLRETLAIQPSEIALLYVGSLIARKGILFLLEQFVDLYARHPDLRLFLVGPAIEPEYATAVFSFIERHDLVDRVIHVPFTDRAQDYYDAADIFVFGSFSEGFGNVLLEAMSRGLPVVSRFLPGVTSSFIRHGHNGYLFADHRTFRDGLETLLADPGFRQRIGAAGRDTVAQHYHLGGIARRVCGLYRALVDRVKLTGLSDPPVPSCRDLAPGPAILGARQLLSRRAKPVLSLVIDTESEFDWSKGVADDRGSVRAVAELPRIQDVCDPFGARICYVVDHPVATNPSSITVMRGLIARGGEIGAHLQPWTTPPVIEPLAGDLAFPGNLPSDIERLKLTNLKAVIERNLGVVPRVYKAGRYGISAATPRALTELGFDVDLSVMPGFDYSDEGGPDFSRFNERPFWFGTEKPLLELPTTGGYVGVLASFARPLWRLSAAAPARWFRVRGILDRMGALSRIRLSPEGYDLARMIRLTRALHARGCRHFSLSLHSSTLLTGFTPYTPSEEDIDGMLARIGDYLGFFRAIWGVTSPPRPRSSTRCGPDSTAPARAGSSGSPAP